MDFNIVLEHFVLVVFLACLCAGYCIKHGSFFEWINNNDIPIILAIIGGILNLFVSGFSIENAVYGICMGLASTGMHQAFKRWVENKTE